MLRKVLHSSRPALLTEALATSSASSSTSRTILTSSSSSSSSVNSGNIGSSSSSTSRLGASKVASSSRFQLCNPVSPPTTSTRTFPPSHRPFSTVRGSAPSPSPVSPSPFPSPRITPQPTLQAVSQWFSQNLPALNLPEDILGQVVTHESWDMGMGNAGHSRRLAFLGRRVLSFYLTLFLTSRLPSSTATPFTTLATPTFLSQVLQTHNLGSGVGKELRLEEVLRWTPAISDGQRGPKETGLWKIRGTCVEALVGAVYHQHGASVARAFFQSKILPSLGLDSSKEVQAIDDLSEVVKRAIEEEVKEGDRVLMELVKQRFGERGMGMGEERMEREESLEEVSTEAKTVENGPVKRRSTGGSGKAVPGGARSIEDQQTPTLAMGL